MIVARSAGSVSADRTSVVTVGTFDGVHLGHRAILGKVAEAARGTGARSAVITFDPHPVSVVGASGEPVRLLTTIDERGRLLEALGIDMMLVLPFTREFSRQTAREFVSRTLVGTLKARLVVAGHDHHFGRGREGGVQELERLGAELGFAIERVPALVLDGRIVSSTAVRSALDAGDVVAAAALLGRPYEVEGTVVRGDQRGRTLGFPTANILPSHPDKMLPARGIYVVLAEVDGATRYGMMSIGVRPTIASGLGETCEVHLLEFEGDLYGHLLRVRFVARLREERRFDSLQDLVTQMGRDREASLAVIGRLEGHGS